jgi:hypothetical protein
MKFLKVLLISLLNLILFAAISILGLAFMLNQTVMDPNFTANEIDKMDMAAVAGAFVQIPDNSNDPNAFIPSSTVNAAINSSIKEAEPALKDELRVALFRTYDYFLGRTNSLNFSISLSPLRPSLKSTLWADLQKSPPTQINGLSRAQVESAFNAYFDQSFGPLFSPVDVDSANFNTQTNNTVWDIKQGIAYYQFWWVTIPLILSLAVAIILLENNLRSSLRNLGFNLFVFGALGIAGDYLIKQLAGPSTLIPGLPAAAQLWLGQFIDDIFAPLNTFSIVVAIVGAVLIAWSFFVQDTEVSLMSKRV